MAAADRIDPQMRQAMAQDRAISAGAGAGSDLPAQRKAGILVGDYWREGLPSLHGIEDRHIPGPAGGIALRIYRPSAQPDLPVILLIHGGAFIVGSIGQAEPAAVALALETPAIVVSTSYRLAPEHPFPAGLKDCAAVLEWVAANAAALGGDPSRLAIAGISAGANLAAAALLETGVRVSAALLVYGAFSSRADSDSQRSYGDGTYGLSSRRMDEAMGHYVPAGTDLDDPRINILKADVSRLPPSLLLVAELDPLFDDSVQMRWLMEAAGVPVEWSGHAGMVHGFINRGRSVDEARRALSVAAGYLGRKLGTG